MKTPPPSHRASLQGFTLLELLVVVSLVLLLAALLFGIGPGLTERNRAVQCSSNLRSIAVLVQNAIADNNGALPWYDKSRPGFTGLWWHMLRASNPSPAATFNSIFTCPSAAFQQRQRRVRVTSTEELSFGYRYNKRIGYNTGSGYIANYTLKNLRAYNRPGAIPIIADTSTPLLDNAFGFDEWSEVLKSHDRNTSGNVLFLDGHVEKLTFPGPASDATAYDLKFRGG